MARVQRRSHLQTALASATRDQAARRNMPQLLFVAA
jgi:hypothetical protein